MPIRAHYSLTGRQQHAFFQVPRHVRIRCRMRIVRYHHNRLLEIFVQALIWDIRCGIAVQIAGGLVGE